MQEAGAAILRQSQLLHYQQPLDLTSQLTLHQDAGVPVWQERQTSLHILLNAKSNHSVPMWCWLLSQSSLGKVLPDWWRAEGGSRFVGKCLNERYSVRVKDILRPKCGSFSGKQKQEWSLSYNMPTPFRILMQKKKTQSQSQENSCKACSHSRHWLSTYIDVI